MNGKRFTRTVSFLLLFLAFSIAFNAQAQTPRANKEVKIDQKNQPAVKKQGSTNRKFPLRNTEKFAALRKDLPTSVSKPADLAKWAQGKKRELALKPVVTSRVAKTRNLSPEKRRELKALRKAELKALHKNKPGGSNARTADVPVIFVDQDANGNDDGSDWENAYNELSDALLHAEADDQIWVAWGTYKPQYEPDDISHTAGTSRNNAFVLVSDVKIYGGFVGGEESIEERSLMYTDGYGITVDPGGIAFATILSGDFADDDGTGGEFAIFSNTSENAYHVVVSSKNVGEAELNGVIIAGGNANGTGTLSINEIDVSRAAGGGIALYSSSPKLTNVVFKNNQATSGSALFASNSPFVMTNAIIVTNSGTDGGIYLDQSDATITNATIAGNVATGSGAGIFSGGVGGSAPEIRNTIIYGNPAVTNSNVAIVGVAVPTFSYSVVEGSGGGGDDWDTDHFGNDDGNNLDVDPQFYDISTGIFELDVNSPAINAGSNGFFAADEDPDLSYITTDILGEERSLRGKVDIGAIESEYGFLSSGLVHTAGRLYVRKGGYGSTEGSSWANAAAEFGDALKEASTNSAITEIWVAHGTYKPRYYADGTAGAGDQSNKAFFIVPNVKIYGGFRGNETSLEKRDLTSNNSVGIALVPGDYEVASILSGDFDDDDATGGGIFGGTDENAYHVVVSAGDVVGAVLDGFIIAGGNSDGASSISLASKTILQETGGGIAIYDSAPTITNVVVRNNQAKYGSGIYATGSTFPLTNALVVINKATSGGIYLDESEAIITNATIAGNEAAETIGSGAGIYAGGVAASVPKIRNTIVWGNYIVLTSSTIASSNVTVEGLAVPSFSYSIVEGSGGSGGGGVNWDEEFGTDDGHNLDDDPEFSDPDNANFSLPFTSPARNAGNNTLFAVSGDPDLSGIKTDVRGTQRLYGGVVDIGAIESRIVKYVDNEAPSGGLSDGSSWENAYKELSYALNKAKVIGGVDELWVAYGTYKPRFLLDDSDGGENNRDNTFVLVPSVKIYGGFAGYENSVEQRNLRDNDNYEFYRAGSEQATILSGDFDSNDGPCGCVDDGPPITTDNAYHVVVSAGDMNGATLDGVIITGGNANGTDFLTLNSENILRNAGGGIALYDSDPVINNVVVKNSQGNLGSGIFADRSDFLLTNALVVLNKVHDKGGIHLLNSSPVITNATIAGNEGSSSSASGAGIYLTGNLSASEIRNSIIYGNKVGTNPNVALSDYALPSFHKSILEGSGGTWNVEAFGTDDGGNLDVNPRFFDAGNGAFGLTPTSPAIDAGDNSVWASGAMPDLTAITSTDVRGTPRNTEGGVDIGAIESLYKIFSSTLVPTDGRLYVKQDGTGNGSSWGTAAGEVADALFAAKLNPAITEIWVAGGVYHPLYRADNLSNANPLDKSNAFLLVGGVKIYGGFAGTETMLSERDLSMSENASILSADLKHNDNSSFDDFLDYFYSSYEIPGDRADNAHHLVYGVGRKDESVVMDGFTLEGANFLSSLPLDEPELLYGLFSSSTLISEVRMPHILGTGISTFVGSSKLSNLTVRNNLGFLGGGISNIAGEVQLNNSLIFDNFSLVFGTGVTALDANLKMVNVTVTGNLMDDTFGGIGGGGAGVTLIGGISSINNSIIFGNLVAEDPADFIFDDAEDDEAKAVISHSIVGGVGCGCSSGTDGGYNLDEDPLFTDVENKDFSLQACSPAINLGTNKFYVAGGSPDLTLVTKDLIGYTRINQEFVDAGAFEFKSLQPGLNGSIATHEFIDTEPHTFMIEGDCTKEILTITPIDLSGNVTAQVWVDNEVKMVNSAVYVQRHFDIVPENDESTATVTLYFTQADFDNFNLLVDEDEYLPIGNWDGEDERIDNLRIYQFHGISSNNSGDPTTYGPSRTAIVPTDVFWNRDMQRWEVTFDVDGFSGFFAGTEAQSPLPVRLVSFGGKLDENNKVKLDWKVTEQQNISAYLIEYSGNGKNFSQIGSVNANTLENTQYSYNDNGLRSGQLAYYRLKIMEMDGTHAYSRLISVKLPAAENMVVYPVPAKNLVWIDWKSSAVNSGDLLDLNGRIITTITRSGATQRLDISGLAQGVYFIKMNDGTAMKLVKE